MKGNSPFLDVIRIVARTPRTGNPHDVGFLRARLVDVGRLAAALFALEECDESDLLTIAEGMNTPLCLGYSRYTIFLAFWDGM